MASDRASHEGDLAQEVLHSRDFSGTDRFALLRRIGSGGMGVVYEALDRERNERVALKKLSRADPLRIYQFKREFRSLTEIVHPNILPLYEFFADGEHWFFTMELLESPTTLLAHTSMGAPESTSSSSLMTETLIADSAAFEENSATTTGAAERRRANMNWDRLRAAFRQLSEGVAELHRHNKLHRDLKPSNVLVREDGRVALLDFGLVADLTRLEGADSTHEHSYFAPEGVTGTILYMSPEQASALPLTPASDWYSVGVMLFQALTHRLPFEGAREAVLRNKQILDAPAASDYVDGIPDDLNQLCCALLRRDPEARLSGREVLACFTDSTTLAMPAPDIDGALPFVGRQKQMAALYEGFGRAVTGFPVVCHVEGPSGAGKSALVGRFLAELGQRPEILVLAGRCCEQESVPYKAIDGLVDALCMRLARLPAEQVNAWLPEDASALARVFPVLRRLIPGAAESPAGFANLQELHSRAVAALGELLARISQRHTLVLAIDDLQWGDLDSAALLARLPSATRLRHLMLITAYRSEYREVSPCLKAFLGAEATDQPRGRIQIDVSALSDAETRELAAKLLAQNRSSTGTEPSTSVIDGIVRESQGSAFFVHELARQARTGREASTEPAHLELDEVLWRRAAALPEDARLVLEVVALAGAPIHISDAIAAAGLVGASSHDLIPPLRTGHFIRKFGLELDDQLETYHDRVRESVVAHLDKAKRKEYHARLARVLEAGDRAQPETVAAHYQGAGDPRAGQFYEIAADRALERLAFNLAEQYLRNAIELVDTDRDRARIYEKMIHFYTDVARFADAYAVGRRATAMFGIKLPRKFNPPALLLDCGLARLRVARRGVANILDLPEMKDEGSISAVRLISAVAKAAYQVRPELCVAVSAKAVNLCLRRGNTPDVAIAYMVFGCIFLGGVLGNYRIGFEFGRLALRLLEKYDNRKQRAEVHFVVGYFATSWLKSAAEAERLWAAAYESGLETGDLFHTGCACAGTIQSLYMRGVPMDQIRAESERMMEFLNRAQLREPEGCLQTVRQAIRNLRGETRDRSSFSDADFDEDEFARETAGFGSRHFAHFYFIDKMQTLYLWGDYNAAKAMADRSAAYKSDSRGMLHETEHVFYSALIASALLKEGRGFAGARRELKRARRRFNRWASLCPDNFEHKRCLLAAEDAYVGGGYDEAAKLYDEAIAAASRYGYCQVQALANRLAARLHRKLGRAARAEGYAAASRESFERWGATALASQPDL